VRMAEGNERPRVWRPLLRFARVLVALLAGGGGTLWLVARESMGGRVEGARRARAERSPQWRDGRFDNRLPRVDGPLPRALGAFAFGRSDHRKPATPIPVVARVGADFRTPPTSGLRVTWLGHSTLLLEIDGARVLIDPVWGERAFPFTFMGPKRFVVPPLPLAELPPIDAVAISHDHYDHLDMPTVKALAQAYAARGLH
jgi:hypothetical protein